jgi:hypothetical protein
MLCSPSGQVRITGYGSPSVPLTPRGDSGRVPPIAVTCVFSSSSYTWAQGAVLSYESFWQLMYSSEDDVSLPCFQGGPPDRTVSLGDHKNNIMIRATNLHIQSESVKEIISRVDIHGSTTSSGLCRGWPEGHS